MHYIEEHKRQIKVNIACFNVEIQFSILLKLRILKNINIPNKYYFAIFIINFI